MPEAIVRSVCTLQPFVSNVTVNIKRKTNTKTKTINVNESEETTELFNRGWLGQGAELELQSRGEHRVKCRVRLSERAALGEAPQSGGAEELLGFRILVQPLINESVRYTKILVIMSRNGKRLVSRARDEHSLKMKGEEEGEQFITPNTVGLADPRSSFPHRTHRVIVVSHAFLATLAISRRVHELRGCV
ncbi:hypothetical protein RRG08_034194 [Elysia crispata]|uniref:Uncharacterized protein n=1 Tax=Elysia crispata TaxID=231223 RepID=A0AAE1A1T4_9GAST|nr:hypothetical protein RRG08_034194 [Elysia crispata]